MDNVAFGATLGEGTSLCRVPEIQVRVVLSLKNERGPLLGLGEMKSILRLVFPYMAALAAVGFCVALTLAFLRFHGPTQAVGFAFLFAILGAAWYGGYGPGIVSVVA